MARLDVSKPCPAATARSKRLSGGSGKGARWILGLALGLLGFGVSFLPGPRSDAGTVEPAWGNGTWINLSYEGCRDPANICGEFIDDLRFSPLTGEWCCLRPSEVPLGRHASCIESFGRTPPREDPEEP